MVWKSVLVIGLLFGSPIIGWYLFGEGGTLPALIAAIVIVYYLDKSEIDRSAVTHGFSSGSYPANWSEIRRRVLDRDGHKCANCGRSDLELHVHHIVPLSRGGTSNPSNLKTLCEGCHKLIHPHMR